MEKAAVGVAFFQGNYRDFLKGLVSLVIALICPFFQSASDLNAAGSIVRRAPQMFFNVYFYVLNLLALRVFTAKLSTTHKTAILDIYSYDFMSNSV
jgi:hypothetical protein